MKGGWGAPAPEVQSAIDLITTRMRVVVRRLAADRWVYERSIGYQRVRTYASARALLYVAAHIRAREEAARHAHFYEKWFQGDEDEY